MEDYPRLDEETATILSAYTAICLSGLCRASIGEGECGLLGVMYGQPPDGPPRIDRICTRSDEDCPGSTLIEQAANQAIAQVLGWPGRNN